MLFKWHLCFVGSTFSSALLYFICDEVRASSQPQYEVKHVVKRTLLAAPRRACPTEDFNASGRYGAQTFLLNFIGTKSEKGRTLESEIKHVSVEIIFRAGKKTRAGRWKLVESGM